MNKRIFALLYQFIFLAGCLAVWIYPAYALSVDRGPYLQSGSPTGVVVRWSTDTDSDSRVNFGTTVENLAQGESDFGSTTDHVMTITGLTPDTRYYYTVGSTSQILTGSSAGQYFDTSPVAGTSQASRFWVLGDSGTANGNAMAVRDAFYNYPAPAADLILMLGDNAYNDGTDPQYQAAVFNMYPDILQNTVLWSTLGNHDGHSADSDTQTGPYYEIFSLPTGAEAGGIASTTEAYYSFDYANVHFICLDSYDTSRSVGGAMYNWLSTDLGDTSQEWIIAYWHHPPYTDGSHDSDIESRLIDMRVNFLPLLEDYGVDLVLGGHSHAYERSDLLDGHYGLSGTLNSSMVLDAGGGQELGSGAYFKTPAAVNDGAAYVVAGSSGKTGIGSGTLSHPAMYISLLNLGSLVIDVKGNRMDVNFLRENSTTPDNFTIIKGVDTTAPVISEAEAVTNSTVTVLFDKPVEFTSAENTSNYAVDNGISVNSATLLGNSRMVQLSVDTMTGGTSYILTVTGVTDLYTNTIVAPGEQATLVPINRVEFQNGVFPNGSYSGTDDTRIAQANPDTNYGTSSTLLIDGDDGSGNDLSTLVKWDISTIPAISIIDTAEISLDVFNSSGQGYPAYAVTRAWNESEATWNQATNTDTWESPGADGGSDRAAVAMGTLAASSIGTKTINLNAEGLNVVQGWVDNPATNYGVIIADTSNTDGVDMDSSETGTSTDRPKLAVTFSPPGDSEAPTRPANLRTGMTMSTSIELSWAASTDNISVVGYEIFRNGLLVGIVSGNSYMDTGLTADTFYGYQVLAYDAYDNRSELSPAIIALTTVQTGNTAKQKNQNHKNRGSPVPPGKTQKPKS